MFNDKPELELKIVQLADDTTIIVNDMESVNNVVTEIERFSSVSGIILNKEKTQGMWLGKKKPGTLNLDIKWTNEPVKCLGIYFGRNIKLNEDLNWKPKLESLHKTLQNWQKRKLTYYGKIAIIKTLGVSKLLYNANCLSVPDYVIKKSNRYLFTFLWGSQKEKVKRDTVVSQMENGGLQMINLENQIKALKIKWISRLLDDNVTGRWKDICKHWFIPSGGLPFILNLNCKPGDVMKIVQCNIPAFYKDVLTAWFSLKERIIDQTEPTQYTILWGNRNIKYNGSPLFYTKWINAGIIYLKDIVIGNRFINMTELTNIIKCPTNFAKLGKLLNTIPREWRLKVKNNDVCSGKECTMFNINEKKKHMSVLQTKDVYKMLSAKCNEPNIV